MNKTAVLIGHRSKAQGAYSPFLMQSEYQFNSKIAERLEGYADIYERPNTPFVSEGTRIKQAVEQINKKRYDLVIELHFNAAASSQAHGATALYYITNKRTKTLARHFTQAMESRIGIKRRDLIPISSKEQRGGTFIITSKADAILLEPFFGSNKQDCELMENCINEYVDIIKELISGVERFNICGRDCHTGDSECNGYCIGKEPNPAKRYV